MMKRSTFNNADLMFRGLLMENHTNKMLITRVSNHRFYQANDLARVVNDKYTYQQFQTVMFF